MVGSLSDALTEMLKLVSDALIEMLKLVLNALNRLTVTMLYYI